MVRAVLLGLCLVACGNSSIPAPVARTTSALTLSSAVIAQPVATTLSCHGGAFCREDVVSAGHPDALDEASADCARRGGTTERAPCPREGRLGACAVGGEAGSITVFVYGAEELARMTSLCEDLDGSLELATR